MNPKSAAIATAVMGAIQYDTLRLELWGSALAANARSKQFDERGASFELYRLSPRICWLVARTVRTLGPCLGGEVGVLTAEGVGVLGASTKTVSWFGSTVGAGVDWRIAQVALLGFTADLGIPLQKYRFELVGETLYRRELSGSLSVYLAAGDVEDAAQDVFIVVHRKLGEFRAQSRLKSWIFAIALHVAKAYRRRSAQRLARTDDSDVKLVGSFLTPEETQAKRQAA